ncbi:NAD(P)H-dependent flavin oxidoreductase [Ethanoligenens sp.]|uniref:NAD(P)H-dependent flavin oxidoreductase n=1 Tax=Ethanoligenens sp. TaxID=2099655 RepID=UPI0039EAC7FC
MMPYFDQEPLVIGDLVIKTPVVQGGMGVGVSLAGLASAVANEGGLGVLSAAAVGMVHKAGFSVQDNIAAVKEEIRRARGKTQGALGINIMVALSDFGEMVKASIEEGIDVIFAGAGLPLNLPSYIREGCKTKLVPIISSARAAKVLTRRWQEKYAYTPDAFVVEGPMAGGHLGFHRDQIDNPAYRLENLLQEVLQAIHPIEMHVEHKIPVIAAGGIFSGADIKRFFHLGASAVQMGTRFVATDECDADIAFKQAYVNCKKEDIGIIQSPVGMPGRAIINSFLRDAEQGKKHPADCPFHCIVTCKQQQSPYCIFKALISACRGKLANGFAFVGANGYKVNEIVSVKKLFETLSQEYRQATVLQEKETVTATIVP